MCNPPFFSSLAEAGANPGTACGGTSVEMVCPGGELAFVRRMVHDSRALGKRVHWYTTMVRPPLLGSCCAAAGLPLGSCWAPAGPLLGWSALLLQCSHALCRSQPSLALMTARLLACQVGKKATLKVLRQELYGLGVSALRTTELAQGRTIRWAPGAAGGCGTEGCCCLRRVLLAWCGLGAATSWASCAAARLVAAADCSTWVCPGAACRWALAWSWAVDPSKASQALPRPAAAVAAAPSQPERQARERQPADASRQPRQPSQQQQQQQPAQQQQWSFTVSALPQQGSQLLALVQQVLRGCGASCRLDNRAWAVHYTAPAAAAGAAAEQADVGQPAKRARHADVQAGPLPQLGSDSPAGGQQRERVQQAAPGECGISAAGSTPAAEEQQGAGRAQHIQGQVLLYQERRGTFRVELSAQTRDQRRPPLPGPGAAGVSPPISAAAHAQHQRLYRALEQRLAGGGSVAG